MAIRSYFITMTGTGTGADPYRPASLSGLLWSGQVVPTTGKCLVLADVSPAQHATLLADTTNVVYLPIEDGGGSVVPAGGTFGDLSPANRATCKTRMETEHIPTQDFSLADQIRRALKLAKRRKLLKQQLGADDFTELLDSLVSAMNAAKRTRIGTALTAAGYDTSVIVGTDTIREAIRKLLIQDVGANRTGDE